MNLCMSLMNKELEHGDMRHAQVVMKELDITYLYAVPQSITDSWWLLGCENVPTTLPSYLIEMVDFNPQKAVGWGLSQEMADRLKENK